MTFPSPTSALDYIKGKIGEFFRQGDVLTARLREVVQLKAEALKRNDQEAAGKLIVMQGQVSQLLQDQIQLEAKLRPFAEAFGYTGLSAVPLVLIPVAVGVASLLYLHFQKITTQRQALDMIKAGMLSPAEAEKLLDGGLGFGSLMGGTAGLILPWAALLIGVYLFIGFRKEKA